MKNIKTLLIAGLLISSTSLFAQEKMTVQRVEKQTIAKKVATTPEERAKKETEQMKNTLNLSEEQVERVSNLNLKVEQKKQAILDRKMTKEKEQKFIDSNMNDKLNALSSILSKEQLEKYKASIVKVEKQL